MSKASALPLFIVTMREADLTFTRRVYAVTSEAASDLAQHAEPRALIVRVVSCGPQDHRLYRTVGAAIAPAMVPQQVQQQQACAAPLYAFQVRGEGKVVAPRTSQDVEGITPRSVVAQTVAVRTRADWYAFSRACRTVARNRVEARNAGESIFWAMIGGRVHRLSVERTSFGMVHRLGKAWRRVCHGTPVALATARLTERPRRALIAAELDWAAKYRRNAMRDARDRNAHRRAMSVKAVRACIAEARGLGSAFDRLPG